jgi:hypothetical protein
MPTEHAPRGGNAFYVGKHVKGKGKDKGKGKGKDQDKGKRGSKRNRDTDNNGTSLSSFASSSSDPPAKQARLTSNTTPALTTEHNPIKPYCYCWFHGWNFSHHGNKCKRILKSNDHIQARINATSPTSTAKLPTSLDALPPNPSVVLQSPFFPICYFFFHGLPFHN